MKAAEAVRVIDGAVFHPDYRIRATALGRWAGGTETVAVEFLQRTYDSSDIDPAGNYYRKVTIAPLYDFDAAAMEDDSQVLFAVLGKLREMQDHENREFLRVRKGGSWKAPFHPHNTDGKALWRSLGGTGS